jgi:hypothetical protein
VVLSFKQGGNSMALAYGQVNDLLRVVSGDQSSSDCRLKNGQQVCSSSNAPKGHGQRAKTLLAEKN